MLKVKDLKDTVDLVMAIEGENVLVETEQDLKRIIDLCNELKYSQGFYGRLYRELQNVTVENLPIVL